MDEGERTAGQTAGAIVVVLTYAVIASLWILLSDRAMSLLFKDPVTLVQVSMAKGWFFVAITSLLLYFLVRRLVIQLKGAHQRELAYQREQKQPPPMLVAIADSSSDAIFAKDEEGRYLLVNNAAARFMGRPTEQILGCDDRAVFPAEQAEMIMSIGRRVMATGRTETNEETVWTAEGERVFLATKGPLHDAQGRIFGIFGISRDITGRKQAEEELRASNERLKNVIDNDVVGVMFWETSRGRLMDANDAFLRLLGYSRSDMEAGEVTWQRLTPPEYVEQSLAEMEKLKQIGRIGPYEKEYFRKDGSRQWIVFAGNSLGDNTCVEFCVDISRLKAAEAELRKHNDELQRFNHAAVDRELRMIELKRQINALAQELGRKPPYDLSFTELPPEEARQ